MLKVFGAQWCTYCKKLKDYLDANRIEHVFVDIDVHIKESEILIENDLQTIPQVWMLGEIGSSTYIGGHDDTIAYLEK